MASSVYSRTLQKAAEVLARAKRACGVTLDKA
jgi:hypothetical protein